MIAGQGNLTTFTYDLVGRQTRPLDALVWRTSFAFDVASQQTTRTDACGFRTTYSYDHVGRPADLTPLPGRQSGDTEL